MARVLIVDDDRSIRQTIRYGLEGRGYQIEEAGDGHEALVVQRHSRAEVAIVDIAMPVMGGLELTARLRREFADLRIIAVTGGCAVGAGELLQMALRLGANASLTKPFRPAELAKLVEGLFTQTIARPVLVAG